MSLHHVLLSSSKTKRFKTHHPGNRQSLPNLHAGFFPCPAGCGHHVSERDVNVHLDERCSVLRNCGIGKRDANAATDGNACREEPRLECLDENLTEVNPGRKATSNLKQQKSSATPSSEPSSTNTRRAKPTSNHTIKQENDAFSHMMKQSAKVFSSDESQAIVQHRFHLHHDQHGRITATWIANEADASHFNAAATGLVLWSANVSVKKIKSIALNRINKSFGGEHAPCFAPITDATTLDLIISSSIPFQHSQRNMHCDSDSIKFNFVQRHSRLSVAQLKSILQKSIRRRAPLPSVRVAMELADKSFGDLIRRLPIIMLEDSFLHEDIGLLVWLMAAESKGYVPSMSVMVRVFQIVFEMASCPRRDELCSDRTANAPSVFEDGEQMSFSLTTPSSRLFNHALSNKMSGSNKCETLIRSMLLRTQYGGMSCDVSMLYSYTTLWLKRFQSPDAVPRIVASCLPASKLKDDKEYKSIYWCDLPWLLHEASHEKSKQLVTCQIVCPGGLSKLNETDICSAGIDFHCSPVVESILSQKSLYAALNEKLISMNIRNRDMDRDGIVDQVKKCIWIFSSSVNRRRTFTERLEERTGNEDKFKSLWDDLLRAPFDDFTKKFVRQRLAY